MAEDDPRDKLRRLAEQLRELPPFPHSPISTDLADFMASAIEGFLAGKKHHQTMDQALGLTRRKSTRQGKHHKLAIEAAPLDWQGLPFREIADRLKLTDIDEQYLQKILKRYRKQIAEHYSSKATEAVEQAMEADRRQRIARVRRTTRALHGAKRRH